jgi:hypothetical protein
MEVLMWDLGSWLFWGVLSLLLLAVFMLGVTYAEWRHRRQEGAKDLAQKESSRQRKNEDTEKNILGRFKNAIEKAYPDKFVTDRAPRRSQTGGRNLMFWKPKAPGIPLTVTVNASVRVPQVRLDFGDTTLSYPLSDTESAIKVAINHLRYCA